MVYCAFTLCHEHLARIDEGGQIVETDPDVSETPPPAVRSDGVGYAPAKRFGLKSNFLGQKGTVDVVVVVCRHDFRPSSSHRWALEQISHRQTQGMHNIADATAGEAAHQDSVASGGDYQRGPGVRMRGARRACGLRRSETYSAGSLLQCGDHAFKRVHGCTHNVEA